MATIAQLLTRGAAVKSSILSAIEAKGVSVGADADLGDAAGLIDQITQAGASGTANITAASIVQTSPAPGDTLTLAVTATGNPMPTLSYRWQAGAGGGFADISGATAASLDTSSFGDQDEVRCAVTATNTVGGVAYSATRTTAPVALVAAGAGSGNTWDFSGYGIGDGEAQIADDWDIVNTGGTLMLTTEVVESAPSPGGKALSLTFTGESNSNGRALLIPKGIRSVIDGAAGQNVKIYVRLRRRYDTPFIAQAGEGLVGRHGGGNLNWGGRQIHGIGTRNRTNHGSSWRMLTGEPLVFAGSSSLATGGAAADGTEWELEWEVNAARTQTRGRSWQVGTTRPDWTEWVDVTGSWSGDWTDNNAGAAFDNLRDGRAVLVDRVSVAVGPDETDQT